MRIVNTPAQMSGTTDTWPAASNRPYNLVVNLCVLSDLVVAPMRPLGIL
jgi:hypothetical protein